MPQAAEARMIAPAPRRYSGRVTLPERWEGFRPREGDIIVCTPPKCGTTWTQAMLTMLVHGGPDLPEKVGVLSPWIDAGLWPEEEARAALARQTGRRVIKTHTPADGFPRWEGVSLVAVYRHPLDVFFSLRKHAMNRADGGQADMRLPIGEALTPYLTTDTTADDFDDDSLATIAMHFRGTVLSGRWPGALVLHYADMVADGPGTVRLLAHRLGITDDERVIAEVARATAFAEMKSNATQYAPAGGTEFWTSDRAFFDSASSGKWQGAVPDPVLALYRERIERLIPEAGPRRWLEGGGALPS